jgi:predicted metal-dependent hydrolase
MKRSKRYKRRPGDMEIRILPDGRVVVVAPDERMIEIANNVARQETEVSDEVKDNGEGK